MTTNEAARAVARGPQRLDASSPVSTTSPCASGSAPDHVLGGIGEHSRPEAALELRVMLDVVAVAVRRQEVRDLEIRRSTAATSGSSGAPLSTKTPAPSGPVRDEVRVRE